jgi:hypothetical protein
MARYYTDTQNDINEKEIVNVVSLVPNLTPMQRADFVARAWAGTLDAKADKKVLGDVWFRHLSEAVPTKIEGVYFPLVRHGSQVVTVTEKLPDLKGGKLMAGTDDVVTFRGQDDKAARAAYDRFAGQSDLRISNVKKVFIERATGRVLSKINATGQTVDVEYRATIQRKAVYFFDTATEAYGFKREQGATFQAISDPMDKADANLAADLKGTQYASIMNSLSQRTDISDASKNLARSILQQSALRLMTGNRVQQRNLKRKSVKGASEDMVRNLLAYSHAASNHLAKLEHYGEIRDAMDQMRAHMKGRTDKFEQARSQVFDELQLRVEGNVDSPNEPSKLVGDLLTVSYLYRLFSPAYSIINAMQPGMVTLPVLAGHVGGSKAAMFLSVAYNKVGGLGITKQGVTNTYRAGKNYVKADIGASDPLGFARQNAGPRYKALFDMLEERGAIDGAAGFELSQATASGRGAWGQNLSKVDRIARQLPQAVEVMNRAVAAVASYDAAKSQGKSDAEARAFAFDMVMNTQGDYSAANAPRFFNNPILRPALQFKKYAQMMTALLARMVGQAFKGASPQERKIARTQLVTLVGVQIAMAGALGLPGLELAKVAFMLAAALGFGEGWEEQERWLKKQAEAMIGQKPAEILTKGMPRLLGIDLSTRLSLADMWTFGEPKKADDRDSTMAYVAGLILGAPASMVGDWRDAVSHMREGEWAKASAKGIPIKFVVDFAKAINADDMNLAERGVQAIGIRPASAARKSEEIGAGVDKSVKHDTAYKKLSRQYRNAKTEGERARLMGLIREHNAQPGLSARNKIHTKSIDRYREGK